MDCRKAGSLEAGLAAHYDRFAPAVVRAMETNGFDLRQPLVELDVEPVRSNLFLCHYEDSARLGLRTFFPPGVAAATVFPLFPYAATPLGFLSLF